MADILKVEGLETQFRTQDGIVHAVNGVSFNLKEGETLGIVGESGCGKSVTMMSMMRLIPSPPGKVVAGKAIYQQKDLLKLTNDEIRAIRGSQISVIFQDPMTSFNPVLTIGRQIAEPLEIHMGLNQKQAYERSAEMLAMVGIPNAKDRLNDYPHQFSGGMRQRAMIAMALVCTPQILIADEPTTALDVTIQAQIVELVKRLRDELGMAMIWITHDLGIIAGWRTGWPSCMRDIRLRKRPSRTFTLTLNIHIPWACSTACRAWMRGTSGASFRSMVFPRFI
jgi:oligopeptide transport system ATP-binding protein